MKTVYHVPSLYLGQIQTTKYNLELGGDNKVGPKEDWSISIDLQFADKVSNLKYLENMCASKMKALKEGNDCRCLRKHKKKSWFRKQEPIKYQLSEQLEIDLYDRLSKLIRRKWVELEEEHNKLLPYRRCGIDIAQRREIVTRPLNESLLLPPAEDLTPEDLIPMAEQIVILDEEILILTDADIVE